jgi:hypothetical protein
MATGNPHHRRLPRDARHLIRRIRALGRTGYVRAGVLHAQVAALDYAVGRRENQRRPLPADTDMHAPGDRVRLGTEVRDLLDRLHASRNLREQQALVREIRHAILRRILIHARRARVIRAAGARAVAGAVWVRDLAAAGTRKLNEGRARTPAPQVRVVGHRQPLPPARLLPDGERAARAPRARPSRERAGT